MVRSQRVCSMQNRIRFRRFLQNEMKLTVVTGSAMIKWHTLNDVFEAFYNQSH